MKSLTSLGVFLASIALCPGALVQPPSSGNFELLILHNNDMHARFEQTSRFSGACTLADREAGKCYGGFPRVAHVVKEARMAAATGQGPPVLYLNAGDTYTGTAWFTIYKWKIAAEFINALQPDAVSLGNNDIIKGSDSLSPLLSNIHTKILASNVILKSAKDNEDVQKSIVINMGNQKVGIVGYLNLDSEVLETTGEIEYIDEIIALKEEVAKLQALDVNIIIALGHSNPIRDIEIAAEVDGLDMVIAGQKNIFNWNGTTTDYPVYQDPIVVIQQSGKEVSIIQSSSYNKYLGKVLATFDVDGEIINYSSQPILLDSVVPEEEEAIQIIKKHEAEITVRSEEVVGKTAVVLDGSSCKTEECNLGNLITDAITYYHATRFEGSEPWTDASIAVIPGGDIAVSIAPLNRPSEVTMGDVLSALPLESNLVAVTVSGSMLTQILEHSLATYSSANPTGQLLQLSGIRAEYDLSKAPGSRLVSAVVRCWSCFVPEYYAIDDWRSYKLLMPSALAHGAYGYDMLISLTKEVFTYDEVTCTAEYINLRSPVYPEVAGRIVLYNYEGVDDVGNVEEEDVDPEEIDEPSTDSANSLTSTMVTFSLLPLALNLRNSLGNHELDNGVSGLTPFIENLTCPVLAANLNLNKEPELEAEQNLMKSVVFDINGTKIGVIGYLTPDTKFLAIKNNVEYIEETEAIRQEAARLKLQGIKILIALGHSGFTKDLEIAEKVEDIDIVIGGHTNTFLWNGTSPDVEKPEGPYPMLVKQKSGRLVPAVQAYAYTKYLGKLHLVFDNNGELLISDGNPILLDNTVPQDPDVLKIVDLYRGEVMKVTETVIGTTSVILDGQSCRLRECNMGNLITDAMIFKYASEYKGKGWTDAPIAIVQGGAVRASIAHLNLPANITKGDLLTVMPFDGNMVKLSITGFGIWNMLEHSVARYIPARALGQFLQVSGLKVEYNFRMTPGARVGKVYVRCGACEIPSYSELNKTTSYNILMPSFLSMGGDGFSVFEGLPAIALNYDELQASVEYIRGHSPVYSGLQDRVVIKNVEMASPGNSASQSQISLLAALIVIVVLYIM